MVGWLRVVSLEDLPRIAPHTEKFRCPTIFLIFRNSQWCPLVMIMMKMIPCPHFLKIIVDSITWAPGNGRGHAGVTSLVRSGRKKKPYRLLLMHPRAAVDAVSDRLASLLISTTPPTDLALLSTIICFYLSFPRTRSLGIPRIVFSCFLLKRFPTRCPFPKCFLPAFPKCFLLGGGPSP